jgi:hypothetical protein
VLVADQDATSEPRSSSGRVADDPSGAGDPSHFHDSGVSRLRDAEQHNLGLPAVRPECLVTDSDCEYTGLFTPVTLIEGLRQRYTGPHL